MLKMQMKGIVTSIALLSINGRIDSAAAFVSGASKALSRTIHAKRNLLFALTDRQIQFWEDVDSGLDTIESRWHPLRQRLDRVRTFAKRARGDLPPPAPTEPFHEPSEEHIDDLSCKPFWNVIDHPDLFPWANKLEECASIIQEEYEAKLAESVFATDSVWQNQVMGKGWSAIRLQRLGIWNEANCNQFPATFSLIKELEIPFAVRGVCFARQLPHSGVQPHSDGRNFILTAHLGLKVPERCWIEVAGKRMGWKEGKLTTIDTSFIHATGNPTNHERHILIIDFWHPELSEAERSALEFIYDLRNKFESGLVPVRKPRVLRKESGQLANLWKSFSF